MKSSCWDNLDPVMYWLTTGRRYQVPAEAGSLSTGQGSGRHWASLAAVPSRLFKAGAVTPHSSSFSNHPISFVRKARWKLNDKRGASTERYWNKASPPDQCLLQQRTARLNAQEKLSPDWWPAERYHRLSCGWMAGSGQKDKPTQSTATSNRAAPLWTEAPGQPGRQRHHSSPTEVTSENPRPVFTWTSCERRSFPLLMGCNAISSVIFRQEGHWEAYPYPHSQTKKYEL